MNSNGNTTAPSQGEFQALLDATVDAVILIDHTGHIQSFNRAGERLFGYAADELIGKNVSVLMTATDRDSHDHYMARYMKTNVPHIIGVGREVDARRKDGTEFPVFLSVGQIHGANPPRFIGLLHDITLRREAMAAIRRERDRANLYLEIAQVFLLALSADLRVQLVNRKGCETLARREIDLLGRDWLEVAVPTAQHQRVRRDIERVANATADEDSYLEHEVLAADGQRRLIGWRLMPMRGADGRLVGYFASGEDITHRRAMEQSMERTRLLLNEAQEIAKLGNFEMFHGGTDGAPAQPFWSPEMYRILGLEPPSHPTPGLDVAELLARIHPEDRARNAEVWRQVVGQPGTRLDEFRVLTPAGELRHVQINYTSTPAQGGGMRVVGTLLDVSDARRAAEDARVAQERMTHVSRLATMGEMAAGIAHELNQPLAAIANYASAATRLAAAAPSAADPDGDVPLALEQIQRQALRAGEIIRRLRALVQNRETRLEAADLNELVREVLVFTQSDARLNDVQLVAELADDLPVASVDRIQIQQILLNLLRNSIEALGERPRGQRTVRIRTRHRPGVALEVQIEDNGPGVPAELVARIFDPFCTTKETGTGLGLAISRTIAEAHQGKLLYATAPAGGARFTLQLPCPTGRDEE
jgi:two-component system sensor kinase FixL